MEKEMTLFDAIKRGEELTGMMKDDLRLAADQKEVADELTKDIQAMQKLQEAAWVVLLGTTQLGGAKVV